MTQNVQEENKPSLIQRIQQNKGKVGAGLLAGVVAIVAIGAMSGGGKKNNVEMRTDEVDAGRAVDSTDPEHIKAIKEYDDKRAQAASEAGASHFDTITAQSNASETADPFVTPPADSTSTDQVQDIGDTYGDGSATQGTGIPQVVEITTIKEVPVNVQAPYDWRNDPSLLAYFVNGQPGGQQGGYTIQQNQGLAEERQRKLQEQQQRAQAQLQNAGGNLGRQPESMAAGNATKQPMVTLMRVGDLPPATLLTPIVSDEKSIVRARIEAGPLRGAILTGSFQQNDKSVSVMFNRMTLPNVPQSIPVNAVALDYAQASTALATSVNRHIVPRFIGTLISAFGSRYADALKSNNQHSNSRTVVNEQTGNQTQIIESGTDKRTTKDIVREAGADSISEGTAIITDLIPKTPTVKVKGNIAIGIYFMEDLNVSQDVANLINFEPVYK